MAKFGVDVSKWQGAIDWPSLAADGILWAGVRASVGSYYTDRTFEFNYDQALGEGILPFPYHVVNPNNAVADQLTRYRLSLDGRKPVMTVVDAELAGSVSNITLRRRHVWFVRDGGDDPDFGSQWILYTNQGFADAQLGEGYQGFKWAENIPLWVASYGLNNGKLPSSPPYPKLPDAWPIYKAWQYTSKGKLEGVGSEYIDLNQMDDTFYGNLRARSGVPEPGGIVPPPPPIEEPPPVSEELEATVAALDSWAKSYE